MPVTFLQRQSGVIHPFLIKINVLTIGLGSPNDLWHGLCKNVKLILALPQCLLSIFAVSYVKCDSHYRRFAQVVYSYR